MKVWIEPKFRGEDKGDGGIRRVVEAQHKWLPHFGVDIAEDIAAADLVATHAGSTVDIPVDTPLVSHTHGLYWDGYDWDKWHLDLNNHVVEAMRRADHVTAPSEWVAQALRRGMWLRPTILHHGVDPDDWEPGPNGGFILWNKNREDPICDPGPVNALSRAMPDLDFVSTFGEKLRNLRITGRLPYLAAQDLLRRAGVYLCTCRETFGIGTLEAMAAGVPVVGWAWGGQREIIQHMRTGWLSAPGDYEGLAEGVRWAINNRAQIAENARADVLARWTWEKAIGRYADLYKDLRARARAQATAPRVSVVVPSYNLAELLPDTLRSLQAQTMTDWEAIIVDDASPDGTQGVGREWQAKDSRIRYHRNTANQYLAGALNTGFKMARGRYFMALDADNMLDPQALERLAGALDADRSIHVAYGAVKFVREDGVTPDVRVSPDGGSGWPQDFSFRDQMLHRNQVPSTALSRRSVFERTGGYRRRLRTAEDAENWTRVASLGFVPQRVTGAVTLIYRNRDESMSRVNTEPDWTAWFPWSKRMALTPFGVGMKPPAKIGPAWPVPSAEPNRIAVIIPVGPGHEDLVIDALDSVEAQTYRGWEAIVVNDTGAPLDIPHPWARILDTGGHKGPGAARNLGIASTGCQLFVPLDADDYLQSRALEVFLETWDETGGVIYSQWYDDKGDGDVSIYDPPEYDPGLLVQKGMVHAVTALYPKAAWEEVGGFDTNLDFWEDWDFHLAMAAVCQCGVKVAEPLFTYRKNTGLRRESMAAKFEAGKSAILHKWSPLWDGKEPVMPCGGCKGGGARSRPAPTPVAAQVAAPVSQPGMVLLEYTIESPSVRTFRAPKSGTAYRFGGIASARRKFVWREDVEHLLGFGATFRVVPVDASVPDGGTAAAPMPSGQLEATGPPAAGPVAPDVPEDVGPPLADDGGVDTAKLTYRELRGYIVGKSEVDLVAMLARERGGQNRVGCIKLLETVLGRKPADEPVPA